MSSKLSSKILPMAVSPFVSKQHKQIVPFERIANCLVPPKHVVRSSTIALSKLGHSNR